MIGFQRNSFALLLVGVVLLQFTFVESLFEYGNYQIDLPTGTNYPLQSKRYRRHSSTRVVFRSDPGTRLHLVCNINFSRKNHRCSDDYFYVGYNSNPHIKGAKYYCGRRTIRKKSLATNGRPIIVVATSSTRNGRYGNYKCVISAVPLSGTAPTAAPAPASMIEETGDAGDAEEPAGTAPAEEPAAETPAEETPAEESPAEESPAAETPAEEAPAEEAAPDPPEETPAEE